MSDNGDGYMMTSDAERIEALQGQVKALQLAVIRMMRVISRGQTGEDAYQALARDLRAEAEALNTSSNLTSMAAAEDLKYLADVFSLPTQD